MKLGWGDICAQVTFLMVAASVAAEATTSPSWNVRSGNSQQANQATETSLREARCSLARLLETGELVAGAEESLRNVWPGYWYPGKPFILTDPGECVLVYTTRAAPPGFENADVTAGGKGAFFLAKGTIPDLAASRGHMDIEYPIDGEVATAVPLRDDPLASLHFLFHEAFHAFQEHRFLRDFDPSQQNVPTSVVGAPEFLALAQVERRILARALDASSPDAITDVARKFLIVRKHRFDGIPEWVANVERNMERIEGSAELVGYAAAVRALGCPDEDVADIVRRELSNRQEPGRLGGQWLLRDRVYSTGAALGLVLDRLGQEWRRALEDGQGFERLLQRVLPEPEPTPGQVGTILREYGYEQILSSLHHD